MMIPTPCLRRCRVQTTLCLVTHAFQVFISCELHKDSPRSLRPGLKNNSWRRLGDGNRGRHIPPVDRFPATSRQHLRRDGCAIGVPDVEEWKASRGEAVCGNEPNSHRGTVGGFPEAHKHGKAAYIRGDGISPICLSAHGISLPATHHKQVL